MWSIVSLPQLINSESIEATVANMEINKNERILINLPDGHWNLNFTQFSEPLGHTNICSRAVLVVVHWPKYRWYKEELVLSLSSNSCIITWKCKHTCKGEIQYNKAENSIKNPE